MMSLFTILLELSPLCAIVYLYLFWNRRRSSRRPRIFYRKSLFNSLAVQYCDDLLGKPYIPSLWAFSPTVHTKYFAMKPACPYQSRTEYLEVKDGRLIGISWPKLDANRTVCHQSPVVMFLPNPLSNDNSIQPLIEGAVRNGFRPCLFLHRRSNALPRLRHASESKGLDCNPDSDDVDDWKDLAEAVLYVATKLPVSSLFLVSQSYGSPTLLKFLAYDARSRFLKGVACVSPAWNTLKYMSLAAITNHDHQIASTLKHSLSFDSFFRPKPSRRNGNKQSCSTQSLSTTLPLEIFAKLKKLTIPMLTIYSKDDPLLSSDNRYRIGGAWKNSDVLLVVETATGGHSGFLEGLTPESWAARLVFLYFEAVDKFKEATIG